MIFNIDQAKPVKQLTFKHYNVQSFELQSYLSNKKTLIAPQRCLETMQPLFEQIKQEHEQNIEALEHNKNEANKLKSMLKTLNVREFKYDYKVVRGKRKTEKVLSSWYDDIDATYVQSDGFEAAQKIYNDIVRQCEQYKQAVLQDISNIESQRKNEENSLKATRELLKLQLKYNIDDVSTSWEDMLSILSSKDKILSLAVAMYLTRNDWSDGCYRVRNALDKFEITSTLDREIFNEISELCEDFADGRCFRDCSNNYDVLFAFIENQELVKDVHICLENYYMCKLLSNL